MRFGLEVSLLDSRVVRAKNKEKKRKVLSLTVTLDSFAPLLLLATMGIETATAQTFPSCSSDESSLPQQDSSPDHDPPPSPWTSIWRDLQHTFTTRQGLIGDYDYAYLFTPNIPPFNHKYAHHAPPFFYPNDRIPLLLILILGLQHALTMISGIVTPILAVARGAFHLDNETTASLVSAGFITSGIATFLQITRTKIRGTQFYLGAGLLSVVGPTFDIIPMATRYTGMLYARGECPVSGGERGMTKLPCPEAYGALMGSVLVCVWVQFAVALVPAKVLKRVFPSHVTGCLLLVLGIYLVTTAGEAWGGGASCLDGEGMYALCPNTGAPKPLPWVGWL